MNTLKKVTMAILAATALVSAQQASAAVVKVTMTAEEVDVQTNGKLVGGSDTMAAWTLTAAFQASRFV